MREELETLIRDERWPADALTLRRTMRELFGERSAAMLAPPEGAPTLTAVPTLDDAPTLIIERGTLIDMPTLPILLSNELTVVNEADTVPLSVGPAASAATASVRPAADATLVLEREPGTLRRAGLLVVVALMLFGLSVGLTWVVLVSRAR
jgi:hypothetical protein